MDYLDGNETFFEEMEEKNMDYADYIALCAAAAVKTNDVTTKQQGVYVIVMSKDRPVFIINVDTGVFFYNIAEMDAKLFEDLYIDILDMFADYDDDLDDYINAPESFENLEDFQAYEARNN